MATFQKGLLLDTNILLDYCLPNRAGHKTSFQLIDTCLQGDIPLYCAVSSLKDVFYLIERAIRSALSKEEKPNNGVSSEIAWGMLERIRDMVHVIGADESDVWVATKCRPLHEDFEDNMIIAACERAGASYLITNDARLREDACVPTLKPSQALALLEEA
jgi:predicted nucleic acid-binding protein